MLIPIFEFLIPLVLLILVIAAAVLWRRTRQAAVLLQLIALSVTFLIELIQFIADQLMKFGKAALFDIIITDWRRAVAHIGFLFVLFMFPAGYLWYALSRKRT